MRIKICGLTTPEDARLAAELGADALGFNFYPKSKRYLAPEKAQSIIRDLPPFVDPVALFVNEPVPQILHCVKSLPTVHTLQLHGDAIEPIADSAYRFIPAFPVRDDRSLQTILDYLSQCQTQGRLPTAVLVDAHVPGEYGGTGQTAPWKLLAEFHPPVPLILAGGLTPENVAEAVRLVRPYAVDVASGVESSPGRKDPDKMKQFIDNARKAVD